MGVGEQVVVLVPRGSLSGWTAYMSQMDTVDPGVATLILGAGFDGTPNAAVYATSSGVPYPNSNEMVMIYEFSSPIDLTPYQFLRLKNLSVNELLGMLRIENNLGQISDYIAIAGVVGSWQTQDIDLAALAAAGLDLTSITRLNFSIFTYGSLVTKAFDDIQIIQTLPPPTNISVSPTSASLHIGESQVFTATISGGVPPYSNVSWYDDSTELLIATTPLTSPSSSSLTYQTQAAGTYSIHAEVTDSVGATASSNSVIITVTAPPQPVQVNISSSPSGQTFMVNEMSYGPTPWSGNLDPGIWRVTAPSSVVIGGVTYNFKSWNDDPANTNPIRDFNIQLPGPVNIAWTSVAAAPTTGTLNISTTPIAGPILINEVQVAVGSYINSGMTPGSYTVSFGDVAGYITPSSKTVSVTAGAITTVEGTYTPIAVPKGTLTVTTTPVAGKIYVNAQLRGTGSWSGQLDIGTYTVSFGDVAGYVTPPPVQAQVAEGLETTVQVIYPPVTVPKGTLTVTTTPVAGPIYVNAELKGTGSWSGQLDPGTYIVSFGEVTGYAAPLPQQATIVSGQTTTLQGIYTLIQEPTYSITVAVTKDGVPVQGATVTIVSGPSGAPQKVTDANGQVIFTDLKAGNYIFQATTPSFTGTVQADPSITAQAEIPLAPTPELNLLPLAEIGFGLAALFGGII